MTLIENTISLRVLQGAIHLLSFPTLPHLAGVLVMGSHRLAVLAQACAGDFRVTTDHGFTLPTGRRAAIQAENGYLLPLAATGAEYAARMVELFRAPERSGPLVARTRRAFDARLNWDAWGREVKRLVNDRLLTGVIR